MTAEEILEQMRALPRKERLRLIERAVHEVAEETEDQTPGVLVDDAIWADVTDAEFDAFSSAVQQGRNEPWRTID